jgi:DNA invertase Pin-like site-specific DNA recombinase
VKLDGYIRVSRVAGREGESFISPDVQRERIMAHAKANGFEIAQWHEDLDVSGGTLERSGLNEALERCARGETDGIVAARLDRLTRSIAGLSSLVERATAEGWNLVALEPYVDLKGPSGELIGNIFAAIGQWERRQRKEGFAVAQERAVARGVHIASKSPTGYQRREDGRLEPNGFTNAIHELFKRRAAGEGWTALAAFLDSEGVVSPYGNTHWTASAVAKIIRNPVYLGQARSGHHVNPKAHTPLVTRAEFEAAQLDFATPEPHSADGLLLSGLVRCAGCRYVMKPDKMRDRGGERLSMYRCRRRHAAGMCPAPATVLARVLEPYVEGLFLAHVKDTVAHPVTDTADVEAAERGLEEAERDFAVYRDAAGIAALGATEFAAGLEVRARRIDDLRREFSEFAGSTPDLDPVVVEEAWPELSTAERRELMRPTIDAVMVRSLGRGTVPVEDRVSILWRGEAPDDFPRRGRRVPFKSWRG